jgi:hypothetical protein
LAVFRMMAPIACSGAQCRMPGETGTEWRGDSIDRRLDPEIDAAYGIAKQPGLAIAVALRLGAGRFGLITCCDRSRQAILERCIPSPIAFLLGNALTTSEIDATMAYARAEKSAATHRAYAFDWKNFEVWCLARGACSLPAHQGLVAA